MLIFSLFWRRETASNESRVLEHYVVIGGDLLVSDIEPTIGRIDS